MAAYLLRRLLLVIPTLIGIMLINFTLTQFVPGGPIEQVLARLEGEGDVFQNLAGSGDAGQNAGGTQDQAQGGAGGGFDYVGARGLPPDFIDKLEVQFGFARFICPEAFTGTPNGKDCTKEKIALIERFFLMMGQYATFDFGESYFRSISVVDLVLEKLPVSVSLGLWSTLIAYIISVPLGIGKAVRDGTRFDTWTSTIIIAAYAIPGLLFAVLLLVLFAGGSYFQWFPLRGLTSENWEELGLFQKIADYFWHMALPLTASTISSFATLTLLTKNSFLEEIRKQYVLTARAKGLSERQVLMGHVFRNAMLIVIAGLPGLFISIFLAGNLIIETVFSLDGLGRLGYEAVIARDYPVMFGTLYFFGLVGLLIGILSDLVYVWVDPRIDFERRG